MHVFVVVIAVVGVLAGCGRTPLDDCPVGECARVVPVGGGEGEAVGGTSASGGFGGSGGVAAGGAAGAGGAGGDSGGCTPGGGGETAVCTFHNGRAEGALEGSGWVELGAGDSVTSPTCGDQPLSSERPCPALTWSTEHSLCVSGNVPALPINATIADYAFNWGLMFGVDVSDIPECIQWRSYTKIRFDVSGPSPTGMRAIIHLYGDPPEITYCTVAPLPLAKAFTSFRTQCWTDGGTSLSPADLPRISKIGFHLPSSPIETRFSDFCLVAINLE